MTVFNIIKKIFKKSKLTENEIQTAIEESMNRWSKISHPTIEGVLDEYLSYIGQYRLENPGVTPYEAHQACMKAAAEQTEKLIQANKSLDILNDLVKDLQEELRAAANRFEDCELETKITGGSAILRPFKRWATEARNVADRHSCLFV